MQEEPLVFFLLENGHQFKFGLLIHHTANLYNLLPSLQDVHLNDDTLDAIVWNKTDSGDYSVKSAYLAQLDITNISILKPIVWKF